MAFSKMGSWLAEWGGVGQTLRLWVLVSNLHYPKLDFVVFLGGCLVDWFLRQGLAIQPRLALNS
jgi:hypothetical protein